MGFIIAILLLIGGYFYLKNYERIDRFVCQNEGEGYEQFGVWPVFVCTFLGAISGCIFVYKEVFHRSAEIAQEVSFTIYVLAIIAGAIGIYETFFRLDNSITIGKKVILLIFSCCFGMLTGAFASVVIICLLIGVALLMLLGKVSMDSLRSSSNRSADASLIDDTGAVRHLEDIGGGTGMIYQDDQGKRWERQIGGSLESEDGDINHTV